MIFNCQECRAMFSISDGRLMYCSKECFRKDKPYREAQDHEKLKQRKREYYHKHPERHTRFTNERYVEENRRRNRERYHTHKAEMLEKSYRDYYLGFSKPKGERGWLGKAKVNLRNVRRFLKTGETPEFRLSQRFQSKPQSNSPL